MKVSVSALIRRYLKRVHTSCLDLAYEEKGSSTGLPIIMVHGFPDDVRTWDGVVPRLADAGCRILMPYLRGFGPTRFLAQHDLRSGQFTALARDIVEFADALGIERFVLVGHDFGARAAYVVAALWPARVQGLVALSVGYGTSGPQALVSLPQAKAYWYQWYIAMDRGRHALEADRRGFCRYLWETWSPAWRFDDQTYEETARSFDNPDFVGVVIHCYRHRWRVASGDPRYEDLEKRLAGSHRRINVPTVVLHGAEDGATLAGDSEGKEEFFGAAYSRRVLPAVGHFVQRERPRTVAEAILSLIR